MRAPELIIFDCDGVLVDSELIACRVDAQCLTEAGFPVTAEEIRDRYVGMSLKAQIADIEARHGRALPAEFAQTYRDRLSDAFQAELKAISGIEALLARLARETKCKTCVASSSGLKRIEHSLSLVGLYAHFHPHVFSAAQVARGKPAPDLFLFAAERMRTAPRDCLVVEDSLPGVEAGVKAGMRVVGFTGGSHVTRGHAERLRAAGAFATFSQMSQLFGFVARDDALAPSLGR